MLQRICGAIILIFIGLTFIFIQPDSNFPKIVLEIAGYVLIFLGIYTAIFGKSMEELTPEQRAKVLDLDKILQTKLNNTFGAQNVENFKRISDEIFSNPIVRLFTMLRFRK